ncbi:hypothetical protein NNJEOMEG_00827 [Fundidesulfovibrio magnetotacticus]|uniref:EamA domain-containing protein n=1 Tax=Fundidesulfovibrio magnetotacticus TaxID=2730080 RepID=A0A6V8LRN4_9BACT|nr:EamA family transporter [Fundidesulfovibrio magnetotacticus]GFK92998.1 hypothetical protein NNJEOMEG_00827 [Fundidesulfovibrio magnetotacticus]
MTGSVAGLVLLSAVLHVLWNTLVKTSGDKLSFAWLTNVLGMLFLGVPFAWLRMADPGFLGPEVLGWAAVSGVMQAFYVVLLFAAYDHADLSVVYPVCRGLAPLLVMLLAGRLTGDATGPLQAVGVALVAAGTAAVGAASRDKATGRLTWLGLALSVLTAFGTAGYSLADRRGMSLSPGPGAVEFLFVSYVVLCVLLTAYCAWRRPGLAGMFSQWKENRRGVLLVSALMTLSYVCIVAALGTGNVVLVTAGRNVGILLATLAGGLLLHERVSRGRAAGSVVIFAGLALLVLG